MRKLFFVLLICSMRLFVQGAETKIALIGDSSEANKIVYQVLPAVHPVKIAIIGNPEKHRFRIDILTEKFSQQPGLTLLERNDIDYIIKEHKLAATALARNGLRIGQLIGADGVIIVSTVKVSAKDYIYFRLVSVKAGIIIGTAVYQLDQQSKEFNWSDAAVRHFSQLVPKLILNRDELINISLLNFRTSDPSIKMTALEQVIPKLLTIYLSRIPQVVVNERWNSWQVAFEKMLKHDFEEIKTGNILIDGEIKSRSKTSLTTSSKNGFIEIAIRINQHTPKTSKIIKISGQTRQLAALIEKLAKKIQRHLNYSSTMVPWDIKAEAQRFYKDAKWAYGFGKMQQAKEAIEVAVALGLDSFDSAILRARILVGEPFTIQDNDYRALHYSTPFQYENQAVENPEKHLLDTCRALDILSELHRRLSFSGYYDKWKNKENLRLLDQLERNFLVYCPRLIMSAYQQKLHKDDHFADTMTMLQLKTRKLFNDIISRSNWEGRNRDNYKQQAYVVFFATGICWYKNMSEWLEKFNKLLQDHSQGAEFYLTRCGLAEGRNRFERCGKRWPFQLKCFETEYYGTATKKLFEQLDDYVAQLESSSDDRKRFDGLVLRDYAFSERIKRGLKIFNYIVDNAKTVKATSIEYKRVLLAIKMIKDFHFSNGFYQGAELAPHIVKFVARLITSMDKPPWEIIVNLCNIVKLNQQATKTLKIAVAAHKKKLKIKDLNSVCKFKYFCKRYNKLITPKAKPPQYIPVKPLHIPLWLDLTDSKLKSYGMHRSYERLCKFQAYGNKLLYIVNQNWSKPFSPSHNQYVINIINTADAKRDTIIMPEKIAGKLLFPKWKLRPSDDNDNAVRNTVLTADPEYRIIYTNRVGDIFAYSERRAKWYLYDSLGLDKAILTEIHGNMLYISFGLPYIGRSFNLIPTGLIAYNLKDKRYQLLFNNQTLKPRYEIAKQHKLNIRSLHPVSDGIYFRVSLPLYHYGLYFYDQADQTISEIITKKNSTFHLSGNSIDNLMLCLYNKQLNSIKPFSALINSERFYYCKSLPHDRRWQLNNPFEFVRDIITFNMVPPFKIDNNLLIISRKNKIYKNLLINYWQPGKIQSKVIPIGLQHASARGQNNNIRLEALISGNSLFILGNNNSSNTGNRIWKISVKQLNNYFTRKLNYPYIFPFGTRYFPTEMTISFWLRQRITMQTKNNGNEIRYTTDGSWPNRTSTLYKKPFVIKRSMKIIARTFRKGFIPSDPFIVSYRKERPRSYVVGDFDGDGKDELFGNVGYLLKTPENAYGISKIILRTKANGHFFMFQDKNMQQKNIAYRKHNFVYWATANAGAKYKRINYPSSTRKSKFLAGDFNGDGSIDTAFIKNNILQIDIDSDGKFDREINYGSDFKADQWLSSDWNGDGKDDIIIRIGTKFSIDTDADGKADNFYSATNAVASDTFVIGDWNGGDTPSIATLKNGKIIPVTITKQE